MKRLRLSEGLWLSQGHKVRVWHFPPYTPAMYKACDGHKVGEILVGGDTQTLQRPSQTPDSPLTSSLIREDEAQEVFGTGLARSGLRPRCQTCALQATATTVITESE